MRVIAIAALCWALGGFVSSAAEKQPPVEPAADGSYSLPAQAAELSGTSVQRNDQTGAIEHWLGKQDRANWKVSNAKVGNYDVAVTWSVAEQDARQGYNIQIDNLSTIRAFTVSTGGEFKREVVGRIMLAPGVHDVTFFPSSMSSRGGLCKVKQIELVPVENLATAAPQEPVELHAPQGFSVEQVAGPPHTSHPMLACFDDRGRLYVTESTGVNADASVLAQSPPHEHPHIGGHERRRPLRQKHGVCRQADVSPRNPLARWIRLYVVAAKFLAIDRYRRRRRGRRARSAGHRLSFTRNVGRHARGIARSRWPPLLRGRAHVAQDQAAQWAGDSQRGTTRSSFAAVPMARSWKSSAARWAMRVGVDFSDAGDCFASGTFGVNADGKRDVLNHCVEGGAYPVLGQPLVDHKMTGGEMPNLTQFGASASSDLMIYRDEAFGPEYRGNLFSAMFNMHKIARHVLEPDGATYRCHNEDLLTSPNADFHPTDVLEDADGSLIVVDTGAWFLIGCPTSVIAKPQLSGGIYRIRRSDAKPINDPRGLSIAWDTLKPEGLVTLLDDARFAVRDRAMRELAARKEDAVPALQSALGEQSPPRTRLNAVWTLSRIDSPEAAAAACVALNDPDDGVRQAAATAAGLFRDRDALPQLVQIVASDKSSPVRREAAASLGRIGDAEAVPALLSSLAGVTDRFLDHALIFALIRLDDREQTVVGLGDHSPEVRRGALIALDQMDHGKLSQEDVTRALETDNARVQQTALEVISRHSGWANQITELSKRWLAEPELSEDRQSALRGVLLAFAKDASIQELISQSLASEKTPQWTKSIAVGRDRPERVANASAHLAAAAVGRAAFRQRRHGASGSHGDCRGESIARRTNSFGTSGTARAGAKTKSSHPTCAWPRPRPAVQAGQPLPGDVFELLAGQCRPNIEPVTRLQAASVIGSAKVGCPAARSRGRIDRRGRSLGNAGLDSCCRECRGR